MDRYQQVGVVTPRESQALRQRDGAVPGPRQCDTIAAGSLQLTAQLLRGRERDGLFRRPCCADGAGIAPAMAGIDDDQRAAGQVVPWPDLACGSVLLQPGGTRVCDGCSHRLSGLRSMVRRNGMMRGMCRRRAMLLGPRVGRLGLQQPHQRQTHRHTPKQLE